MAVTVLELGVQSVVAVAPRPVPSASAMMTVGATS